MKGLSTDEQTAFYQGQILRLRVLRFLTSDADVRGELTEILWRWSHSEEHAKRVIDACIEKGFGESGREVPSSVDLIAMCQSVPATTTPATPAEQCSACNGSGWVETITRGSGVFADQVYTGLARCECMLQKRGAA